MRRIVLLAVAVVALVAAAPASARVVAHLHAPGHHPKVGKPWPVKVSVRNGRGHRISGRMDYEFVFRGQVVAHAPGVSFRRGRARDKLKFPGRSIGYPLTVRFVIKTHAGTAHIDYRIRVRR